MATALASISIYEQQSKPTMNIAKHTAVKPPSFNAAVTTTPSAAEKSDDGVRIVGIHEYKEAALCLAHAFKDDHTTHYFLNTPDSDLDEAQKWEIHVNMMEYITYAHCMKGLVTTVGPNYDAVALWMPPGKNMDDLYTIIRSGMWRLNYKFTAEGRHRFFNEFLPLLGDSKSKVMGARDTDSWYLVYIGTRETARGKGYAKKLITHVTDMADADGKPCYLESSNDVNPKIYGKYGFEIKKKVYLQREHVPVELDLMVREPKVKRNSFLEKETEMRAERL